jgi:hypothetical protein
MSVKFGLWLKEKRIGLGCFKDIEKNISVLRKEEI